MKDGYISLQIDSSSKKYGNNWAGSIAIVCRHARMNGVEHYLLHERDLVKRNIKNKDDLYHITNWVDLDDGIITTQKTFGIACKLVVTDHAALFFNENKKSNMFIKKIARKNNNNIETHTDKIVIWCWVHRAILVMKKLVNVKGIGWLFGTTNKLINLMNCGIINSNILKHEMDVFESNFGIRESLQGFIQTRWQYMSVCFHIVLVNRVVLMKCIKEISNSKLLTAGTAAELLKELKWSYWWCLAIRYVYIYLCTYINTCVIC